MGALLVVALATLPATSRAGPDDDVAHQHFEEGEKAFAAGDYARAGEAFEAANTAKPHEDALYNAARSWERAGDHARAANLYRAYLDVAPGAAADKKQVFDALAALAKDLGRIDIVAAAGATISIDGKPVARASVYVVPGEHVVAAAREGDAALQSRVVTVAAGATLSVVLDAVSNGAGGAQSSPSHPIDGGPPASSATSVRSAAPIPSASASSAPPPVAPPSRHGISPWFAIAGGGLTAVSGAFLIASGVDTLMAKSQYDTLKVGRTPSEQQDLIDQGVGKTNRTNALIGVTAALGITTGVLLIFTDYGSSAKKTASFDLEVGATSASLRGRF